MLWVIDVLLFANDLTFGYGLMLKLLCYGQIPMLICSVNADALVLRFNMNSALFQPCNMVYIIL